MYKSGDLTKNIENLKKELKTLKFPDKLTDEGLASGNPIMFLPIIHFCFLSYSKYVAQYMIDNDYELFSKNDKEFFDKVHNALIHLFNYKPTINSLQFFKTGQYAEAKVIFCLEIIKIVKQCNNNLVKKNYSNKASKQNMSKTDSFKGSKRSDDENINYKNKVRVINHQEEDIYSEPNEYKFDMRFSNMASPKFNSENEHEFDKSHNSSKKKFDFDNSRDSEPKYVSERYNSKHMRQEELQVEEYNNSDNRQDKVDFSAVIEIINNLAVSVKDMTSRVETFKNNMEDRVGKLEAEITLIKNRLNIIEANKLRVSDDKIAVTESNEHIFSFANEDAGRPRDVITPVVNTVPTRILTNHSDTGSYLQRIQHSLEESKKLLAELK
jgi:hypothetical protein